MPASGWATSTWSSSATSAPRWPRARTSWTPSAGPACRSSTSRPPARRAHRRCSSAPQMIESGAAGDRAVPRRREGASRLHRRLGLRRVADRHGSRREPGVLRARRPRSCSHETDATVDDLADVSVKNHRHAVDNPNAMYRKDVHPRGGARQPGGLPAAHAAHAVRPERGRGGGGADELGRGRTPRRRPTRGAAIRVARVARTGRLVRARSLVPGARPDQPHASGPARRLRGGRHRARRPRPRRVPGHRRGVRAARLPRPRLCRRATRRTAALRRHRRSAAESR